MVKQSKLLTLNAAIFILLVLQVITGIRLWLVDLKGWEDSTAWMNVHIIIGFSLVALIARQGLEKLVHRHNTSQQKALRGKIILLAAAGKSNSEIVISTDEMTGV